MITLPCSRCGWSSGECFDEASLKPDMAALCLMRAEEQVKDCLCTAMEITTQEQLSALQLVHKAAFLIKQLKQALNIVTGSRFKEELEKMNKEK